MLLFYVCFIFFEILIFKLMKNLGCYEREIMFMLSRRILDLMKSSVYEVPVWIP